MVHRPVARTPKHEKGHTGSQKEGARFASRIKKHPAFIAILVNLGLALALVACGSSTPEVGATTAEQVETTATQAPATNSPQSPTQEAEVTPGATGVVKVPTELSAPTKEPTVAAEPTPAPSTTPEPTPSPTPKPTETPTATTEMEQVEEIPASEAARRVGAEFEVYRDTTGPIDVTINTSSRAMMGTPFEGVTKWKPTEGHPWFANGGGFGTAFQEVLNLMPEDGAWIYSLEAGGLQKFTKEELLQKVEEFALVINIRQPGDKVSQFADEEKIVPITRYAGNTGSESAGVLYLDEDGTLVSYTELAAGYAERAHNSPIHLMMGLLRLFSFGPITYSNQELVRDYYHNNIHDEGSIYSILHPVNGIELLSNYRNPNYNDIFSNLFDPTKRDNPATSPLQPVYPTQ